MNRVTDSLVVPVVAAVLMATLSFAAFSQVGCAPAPGTGGASNATCDELMQDYLNKFTEMTAAATKGDQAQVQQLMCEAYDIINQILAQGCAEASSSQVQQFQQIVQMQGSALNCP